MILTRVRYCLFEQGFFHLSKINEEQGSEDQVAYQFLTFTSQFKIALRDQQFAERGKEKSKGRHQYIEILIRKRGKQETNTKTRVFILGKRFNVKIRNLF